MLNNITDELFIIIKNNNKPYNFYFNLIKCNNFNVFKNKFSYDLEWDDTYKWPCDSKGCHISNFQEKIQYKLLYIALAKNWEYNIEFDICQWHVKNFGINPMPKLYLELNTDPPCKDLKILGSDTGKYSDKEIPKYLLRVGPSKDRVTQGKIYPVIDKNIKSKIYVKIKDDSGLHYEADIDSTDLWKEVPSINENIIYEQFISVEHQLQLKLLEDAKQHIINASLTINVDDLLQGLNTLIDNHKTNFTTQGTKPMSTTFATEHFINNRNVKEMTEDQMINAIRNCENEIKFLKEVKSKSKAIDKKVKAAEETITKIVEFLDKE